MCDFNECLNKNIECYRCRFNIEVGNFYKPYEPACPLGYDDCVNDPAYIKCYHPAWYKELYGESTPEEVAKKCEDNCYYDDEDK